MKLSYDHNGTCTLLVLSNFGNSSTFDPLSIPSVGYQQGKIKEYYIVSHDYYDQTSRVVQADRASYPNHPSYMTRDENYELFVKVIRALIVEHDNRNDGQPGSSITKVCPNGDRFRSNFPVKHHGMVMATTSHTQKRAEDLLERYGFKRVGGRQSIKYNGGAPHNITHSLMTVWLMDAIDFYNQAFPGDLDYVRVQNGDEW